MKIHCASWFIETLPYAKGCQIDRIGYIWSEIIESLGMYLDDVSKSLTRIFLDLVRWTLAVPCKSFLITRNTNSFDLLVLLLNLFSICFRVGIQPWLAILQSLGMVEPPWFYPPIPLPTVCPTNTSKTFLLWPQPKANTELKKTRITVSSNVQNLLLLFGVHLLAQTLVVPGAFGSRSHRMDVAIEGIPEVLTGIMEDQIFVDVNIMKY